MQMPFPSLSLVFDVGAFEALQLLGEFEQKQLRKTACWQHYWVRALWHWEENPPTLLIFLFPSSIKSRYVFCFGLHFEHSQVSHQHHLRGNNVHFCNQLLRTLAAIYPDSQIHCGSS